MPKYSVISHTHWDREWYMPLEQFKIKLVEMIDHLLEILEAEPDYRFHLDAQTIVLEDYLSVKPGKRPLLEKYIKEGRILIGPWYIQNDFYLTSGEATVRNLLIGSEIAEDFGGCTWIGYCADQFGVIGQLPQIYNRFGIDSCIFGRGYNFDTPKCQEFYWDGKDGSSILCSFMTYWYNNAQRFSENMKTSLDMVNNIKENMKRTSIAQHYLLMNGVDHLEAQENLLPILKKLNELLPEGEEIKQETMSEYLDQLRDDLASQEVEHYLGEMRHGGEYNILAGTLSSRMYLKQNNDQCQTLLENQLEPLYSYLHSMGIKEYPKEYMRYLWKLLLENHPHDSICGCSIDPVHNHMMDRFARIKEAGEDLLSRGMDILTSYIDRKELKDNQYLFTVFNPSQSAKDETVEAVFDFIVGENVTGFCVTDSEGREVAVQVLSSEVRAKGVFSPINLPGAVNVTSFHIQLRPGVINGLSYRTFTISPVSETLPMLLSPSQEVKEMENEWMHVTILDNGTVDLLHKETGVYYKGLFLLEESMDIGDSYVYANDEVYTSITSQDAVSEIKWIQRDEFCQKVEITYTLMVPSGYCEINRKRSDELSPIPVTLTLTLEPGKQWLGAKVNLTNTAKNHRLRMLYPTMTESNYSFSGNPFDVVRRVRGEGKVAEQPNTAFVNVDGLEHGLAVFNRGLYEYEHLSDEQGTIALTLLRGNGYVSFDPIGNDLIDDRWRTKDNQCMGEFSFDMAVYPHAADWRSAGVVGKADAYTIPLLKGYQPVDTRKFSGGRPFVQGTDLPELFYRAKEHPEITLKLDNGYISLEDDENRMRLSAIKQTEKGKGLLVRLYNTTEEAATFTLGFSVDVQNFYRLDLRERRLQTIESNPSCSITLDALPGEIITIEAN